MTDELDADAMRRWCHRCLEALGSARDEIDRLNVYPVPDADTGTNLYLTMEAATQACDDAHGSDAGAIAAAAARGALMGARGNSGVILSQLLRGVAEVIGAASGPVRGEVLARGLEQATELGYAAVGRPVEGTMLSVAGAAAKAARAIGSDKLGDVAIAAAAAAHEALARTPEQLDVLARAGVVDAGGRGLTVALDVLVEVVTGRAPEPNEVDAARERDPARRLTVPPEPHPAEVAQGAYTGPAWEVMYLLRTGPDGEAATAVLRARLGELGESVAVSGGGDLWSVHVHVDDVGPAIEAGMVAGQPSDIRITDLLRRGRTPDVGGSPLAAGRGTRTRTRTVLALVPAAGMAALFEAAGASTIVVDGAGVTASQVLAALSAFDAPDAPDAPGASGAGGEIVLLPNSHRALTITNEAADRARESGADAVVIPTRACVQGLAALAVHDSARRFADDVVAMTAAAGATRWGEVKLAVERSLSSVGVCDPGDALGLIDDDVVLIGADLERVAEELLDRLLAGGGELVTLITGDGAPEGVGERLAARARAAGLAIETAVYDSGQPGVPLLFGVE